MGSVVWCRQYPARMESRGLSCIGPDIANRGFGTTGLSFLDASLRQLPQADVSLRNGLAVSRPSGLGHVLAKAEQSPVQFQTLRPAVAGKSGRDRAVVLKAEGAARHHGFPSGPQSSLMDRDHDLAIAEQPSKPSDME